MGGYLHISLGFGNLNKSKSLNLEKECTIYLFFSLHERFNSTNPPTKSRNLFYKLSKKAMSRQILQFGAKKIEINFNILRFPLN